MDLDTALATLELEDNYTAEEVRTAYLDLVKVWHPDRFADPRLRRKAEEKLKEINEAYKALIDTPRPELQQPQSSVSKGAQRTHAAQTRSNSPRLFSEHDELVVPASRSKLLGLALGSAFFVLSGFWMLSLVGEGGAVVGIIGAASVIFFGLCGAYAIRRIVRPEPAVVISREGILDNASAISVGLIRWHEIANLREYEFKAQTFLGVVPKDLDRLLASQPTWKRSAIRANVALGAAPINIPQVVLPVRVSELLYEIRQRYRIDLDA